MYKPEQRIVFVNIMCSLGWISGEIYLGKINLFLDSLNSIPAFLKLAGVTLQDGQELPFLGLQRKATQIVIPREPEAMIARSNPAEKIVKRIGCLLQSGNIEGELRLPPDIRVSDFMAKKNDFFLLHKTSGDICCDGAKKSKDMFSDSPPALVNADSIIGLTEL